MQEVFLVSSVLLWAVVIFNLILTLAVVRRVNTAYEGTKATEVIGLTQDQEAPDFIAETLAGETMTLSSFLGKPTAFVFISPGCRPCREELPNYQAMSKGAERAGAQLVLVSVGSREGTTDLVEEFSIDALVLIAPENSNTFMSDYKMRGTPSYSYIDAQGKVQSAGRPTTVTKSWQQLTRPWGVAEPQLVGISTNGRR